ncbi:MAG: integrase core domain-containing protein [Chloroflexaceae bacterium]|jgi:transposase InsO family protein|nr:integrase core domain-containing protein [Chloroflexaceae bacterium]
MSRKGNGWDNAVVERCFATLKTEIGVTTFASHATARSAVFDDIERFYNRQRLHSTLNEQSPWQDEQAWRAQQAIA